MSWRFNHDLPAPDLSEVLGPLNLSALCGFRANPELGVIVRDISDITPTADDTVNVDSGSRVPRAGGAGLLRHDAGGRARVVPRVADVPRVGDRTVPCLTYPPSLLKWDQPSNN